MFTYNLFHAYTISYGLMLKSDRTKIYWDFFEAMCNEYDDITRLAIETKGFYKPITERLILTNPVSHYFFPNLTIRWYSLFPQIHTHFLRSGLDAKGFYRKQFPWMVIFTSELGAERGSKNVNRQMLNSLTIFFALFGYDSLTLYITPNRGNWIWLTHDRYFRQVLLCHTFEL